MAETRSYTVRPSPKAARADLKDTFWIYLSPANLLLHGLRPGDVCEVKPPNGVPGTAIVFDNAKIQDTVIQTSKALQDLYNFRLGDKVTLSTSPVPVAVAQNVTLNECLEDKKRNPMSKQDQVHWAWIVEDPLRRAEHICQGMVFENIEAKRQIRSFEIASINGCSAPPFRVFRFESDVEVRVEGVDIDHLPTSYQNKIVGISKEMIAGLDHQIQRINQRLVAYGHPQRQVTFPAGYPSRQGGMLLHGPSGTGKTTILNQLATAGWKKVLWLEIDFQSQRESDLAVRRTFTEARRNQPSVIIVDKLESIAGKVGSQVSALGINIAQTLCSEMDHLDDGRILVVAATRTLSNVDEDLRAPGRFDFDVEMTIPDSRSRYDLLKLLSGFSKDAESPELQRIGDRTHGYVGADLLSLFRCAMDKAEQRALAFRSREREKGLIEDSEVEAEVTVKELDLSAAMDEVRPTAMREVFLETPQVRWSDIGGQQNVKKSLQKAIEWPFKYPGHMARLGLKPKKGLLLYGPPGCSKTLAAKAVATETDLNFIAVRGAELLNMYVGESERAVREVFRKARAASPSIIFFDEIDALGASRDSNHGGLNVLTTLLNELDGIEDLKGVFVLAATNNPAVLDPALIRPGRFTTLLYVGLPDHSARSEILRLHLHSVACESAIDIPYLASETEGYSGAEIVDICQKAGEVALEMEVESGLEQKITMQHLRSAIESTDKGVSAEQIQAYEQWKLNRR